ncbi:hypothetical protein ACQPZX_11420 [Actinoplanes sp. CA-142083]|uniref:hypothetical protein n=1 Tax=Actinoplanes sp. CA-142083 TaxID=3239903 RepID=UPI003D91A61E
MLEVAGAVGAVEEGPVEEGAVEEGAVEEGAVEAGAVVAGALAGEVDVQPAASITGAAIRSRRRFMLPW